jgi:hypothetical protein
MAPLPVPVAPEVMVSQDVSVLCACHVAVESVLMTRTDPVPPAAATFAELGLRLMSAIAKPQQIAAAIASRNAGPLGCMCRIAIAPGRHAAQFFE